MDSNSKLTSTRETLRVYCDNEFTDFINTEPISIGLAAESGEEFYAENLDFNRALSSDFVKANIYPLLDPVKYGMSEIELSARLWCWVDALPCKNIIVTVDYPTDWTLFKYLMNGDHPKVAGGQNIFTNMAQWVHQNMNAAGGGPYEYQQMWNRVQNHFALGVQDYFKRTGEIPHHALSDAKANREAYTNTIREYGMPL